MKNKSILIIQTAFIGDAILASAMAETIHHAMPQAHIDLLVRKGNEGLYAGHPYLRQVLAWNKTKNKYSNLFKLLKHIRHQKYYAVVNAQRFAATGLLTAFSGAQLRIGYNKNPLSGLFTHQYPHQIGNGQHEVERNHTLLQAIGNLPPKPPRLYPTAQHYQQAQQHKPKGPYVCIAPASVWFTKQWPAHQWVALINALPANLNIVLMGGPHDANLCQKIADKSQKKIINLAGKLSLPAAAAFMEGAVLNYVNDSAPMHLCSARNAPVCAVYCSTVPNFGFGPLSSFSRVAQIKPTLPCRPCGLHGHAACPQQHFKCANISIDLLLSYYQQAKKL